MCVRARACVHYICYHTYMMNIHVCIGLTCYPQYAPDDPPSTGQKCDDLGTAWGSLSRPPSLPSLPSSLPSLPLTLSLLSYLSFSLLPSPSSLLSLCHLTHSPKCAGVCSVGKPLLPGSGFDYDVDSIKRTRSIPLPDLFLEQPGCGIMPFVVRSNSAGKPSYSMRPAQRRLRVNSLAILCAGRFGGGLYQEGCDEGLNQKV